MHAQSHNPPPKHRHRLWEGEGVGGRCTGFLLMRVIHKLRLLALLPLLLLGIDTTAYDYRWVRSWGQRPSPHTTQNTNGQGRCVGTKHTYIGCMHAYGHQAHTRRSPRELAPFWL